MVTIVDKIPGMSMRETVDLWRNAIRILTDRKRLREHEAANRVLEAIDLEWRRRRADPNLDGIFAWPSTEARPGNGGLDTEDWIKEGLLQYVGYRVGSTNGEQRRVRERILAELFGGHLPPAFPTTYLDDWGTPGSAARLQKIAETIAALTRNARRRRDSRMAAAIRDWESDLEYLYCEFYMGKFYFAWPNSNA